MSLRQTARDMRAGRVTGRDLVERCLERIEALQPSTNAFIHVDAVQARRDADAADEDLRAGRDRGLLHGVPISLKDLLDQQGCVTTAGSRSMTDVAAADAPATAALRSHGPVLLGRTNMHEFALGTTSEDSGFGPVRHPRDPSRVAGGSSGGSAVAVATGMSHLSIGSDTGGSIRIPSAVCGLVGLKPAWGEVSLGGVVPLSPTLDCIGPLATSVEDAWYGLQALRLHGQLLPCPEARRIETLRIGVLRDFGWHRVEAPIGDGVLAALDRLAVQGAQLQSMPLASAASVATAYVSIVMREALDFHGARLPVHAGSYTPAVRARLQTVERPSDEEYGQALGARARVQADVEALLHHVDVLALPGLAIAPPRIGQASVEWQDGQEPTRIAMLRLTQPFNLSRHPAIVLPVGATADGWSISLQLVGRETASLVAVARAVEGLLTPLVGWEDAPVGLPSLGGSSSQPLQ